VCHAFSSADSRWQTKAAKAINGLTCLIALKHAELPDSEAAVLARERIEQRRGCCHRYAKKDGVAVVNVR
jgi:hypothetical protein